ncbi:ImmA/IrrE family metallo-endopeptidase [Amycolatopsis alba]|uniref:ImmA/IrrE family metallo-endopeptidase n=1 Tax=Amycolatopsis alba TaxID=76020 RepID=UPI001427B497|nr:ImmA/IrrE family metallo-endopeptidase [Amycolatopsis alba]
MIDGLDIPDPFDVQVLCDRLTTRRGRPLRLAGAALPADSPGGLLVSTESADYIFYDSRLSSLHQLHVIAHEIGHLLLGHRPGDDCAESSRIPLPDDFSPTLIRHMLGRSHYDDPDEFAAEVFATLILRRVGNRSPEPPEVAPEVVALVARLERSLRHHDEGLR